MLSLAEHPPRYAPPMRRRALTEGTREQIRAALEESRRDRAEGSPHPEPEKAEQFERALAALNYGALEVAVEHAAWRVAGEPARPQFITVQRTREKILAELSDYRAAMDWSGAAMEFEHAAAAIQAGALAVFAGGMLYRVVED